MILFKFKGNIVTSHESLPENTTHIVYKLTYSDDTFYIGYKTIRSIVKLKPTKAQLAIRKNYVRKEMKKHNFIDYQGSSSENRGKHLVSKEILHLTSSKRTATYLETKELFNHNAIFNKKCNNKNIAGKWFDNAMDGYIEVL